MTKTKAIGIFDSGIGGLTVMQQIMHTLPQENIIYFGDTARLPYGEKSPETIIRYSIENTHFLLSHDVKAIVVACNTATALAIDELGKQFQIPLIGVIEPGVEKAIELSKTGNIAVLGTRGTINSGVYSREIWKRKPEAIILPIACPLLVPLVEENFIDHAVTRMILKDYLKPIIESNVDTVLLGCTHYPLLANLIQEEVGPDKKVINSASACAQRLRHVLHKSDLANTQEQRSFQRFFVSDDPHRFQTMGKGFLGIPIEINKVERA